MKSAQPKDPEFDASPKNRRRMGAQRIAVVAVCAFVVIGICGIAWWMTLASFLPEYVAMTSLTTDEGGTTVGRKLLEVGAYPLNGKLYDSFGREIIFFGAPGGWGANPGGGILEERKQLIKRLLINHMVIELRHHLRPPEILPQ